MNWKSISLIIIAIILGFGIYLYPKTIIAKKTDTSLDQVLNVYTTMDLDGDNQNTPNSDHQQLTTTRKKRPALYILFKAGCKTCQSIFPEEERFIKAMDKNVKQHIYYVNIESNLGQELIKKHNISQSSAVIISTKEYEAAYNLNNDDSLHDSLTSATNQLKIALNSK